MQQILEVERIEMEDELQELYARLDDCREEVATAAEKGDLSENADYDTAIRRYNEVMYRINSIEAVLTSSTVIEPTNSKDYIGIGSILELSSSHPKFVESLRECIKVSPESGEIITFSGDTASLRVALMSETELLKPRVWKLGSKQIKVGTLQADTGIGALINGKSYGDYNIREASVTADIVCYSVRRYDA